MALEQTADFLDCLPIPNYSEAAVLQMLFEDENHEGQTIEKIAAAVKDYNPNIERIIDCDIFNFLESGDDSYNDVEIGAHAGGITAGYDFAIGCITYLFYFRSFDACLEDFLANTPNHRAGMPVQDISQKLRCLDVLDGRARVDPSIATVSDSTDLARDDTLDYLFEAVYLETLYKSERRKYAETGDHPVRRANREGFKRGFQNAIEMYIQSYEQDILNAIESGV